MFLKQLNKSLKHYNKLIMRYFIYKLFQRSEIAGEPFEKGKVERAQKKKGRIIIKGYN